MTVNPVNAASLLENIKQSSSVSSSEFLPFEDFLKQAVNAVKETESAVNEDIVRLALGDADALHNISIDAAKAELAIETLVAVRNKALEAYNEIMRTTL